MTPRTSKSCRDSSARLPQLLELTLLSACRTQGLTGSTADAVEKGGTSLSRTGTANFSRPHRAVPDVFSGGLVAKSLLGLVFWLGSAFAVAGDIELNPAHPQDYTVVEGDTLWTIAGRFLARPWEWTAVWHDNPQIENPNLIYPGDVITLNYVGGQPRLQVGVPSEVRWSPKIRANPIAQAIPVIPMNTIHQFLSRPKVVTNDDELKTAPYIVALTDRRVVGGAGDTIYVRSIPANTGQAYTVFRPGPPYADAETGEILGYEALYVGDTRLDRPGDPATLQLTQTEREARIGDRLLPVEQAQISTSIQPHAPKTTIRGHILRVIDGISQIGQYSIAAIDRGAADGVEVGHVLDILQKGRTVRDFTSHFMDEAIDLPEEKAGVLLIFRTFDRVSFGLIMQATRSLHVNDIVQTP